MRRFGFQIALAVSISMHLMVMAYTMHEKSLLQRPVQKPVLFVVQLLQVPATLPVKSQDAAVPQLVKPEIKEKQVRPLLKRYPQPHQENKPPPVLKKLAPSLPSEPPQASKQSLIETQATKIDTTDSAELRQSEPSATLSALKTTELPAQRHTVELQPAEEKLVDRQSLEPKSLKHEPPKLAPHVEITGLALMKTGVSISASYAKNNRKPDYPAMSRRLNEEGVVELEVLVLEDGNAGRVEIKKSSGFPLLDEAAKNAVQAWRFNPAKAGGKEISETYALKIPFVLLN